VTGPHPIQQNVPEEHPMLKTRLLHPEILASGRDVALAVSTGDQRIYANLLLTIGVRLPGADGHPAGRPSATRPVTRGEP
jgi:hypothetical protein